MEQADRELLEGIRKDLNKILKAFAPVQKKGAPKMVRVKSLKEAIPRLTHNTLNTLRRKYPHLVEKVVNEGEKNGHYIYNLEEFLKIVA